MCPSRSSLSTNRPMIPKGVRQEIVSRIMVTPPSSENSCTCLHVDIDVAGEVKTKFDGCVDSRFDYDGRHCTRAG